MRRRRDAPGRARASDRLRPSFIGLDIGPPCRPDPGFVNRVALRDIEPPQADGFRDLVPANEPWLKCRFLGDQAGRPRPPFQSDAGWSQLPISSSHDRTSYDLGEC
jgi:hypothetical protein